VAVNREEVWNLFRAGKSREQIAGTLGVSKTTVHRVIRLRKKAVV
jgi:DNA-binding NarL/FixJ family response regulator